MGAISFSVPLQNLYICAACKTPMSYDIESVCIVVGEYPKGYSLHTLICFRCAAGGMIVNREKLLLNFVLCSRIQESMGLKAYLELGALLRVMYNRWIKFDFPKLMQAVKERYG